MIRPGMTHGGGDDDALDAREASRTEVLPPTRLLAGKYRLGRLLGEGGMGAVYEAEHTGLGARVAIKLLSEHIQNERAIARFRREARAMAAVRHDNVVTVTDTGTDEEGTPFLVMELLEGESLNALIKRERRVTPEAAVPIAMQMLAGLAAAHDRGIVHRDLKPGNVFLAWGNENDRRVKILDFGISKFAEGGTRDLTAEGTMIGTPHYMAPEQARGDKEVDKRADLYGVGVLLYRMVTGRLPFSKKPSDGLYEQILAGEIPPPREVAPDLPEPLEQVILKSMMLDPNDRYPDARAMRRALIEAVPDAAADGTIPPSVPSGTPPPMDAELGTARTISVPHGRAASPVEGETRGERPSTTPRTGSHAGPGAPTPQPVGDAAAAATARRPGTGIALGAVSAIAALVIAVMFFGRQDAGEKNVTTADGEGETAAPAGEPLRFGIAQYLSNEQVAQRHRPLAEYLQEQLDRPVELAIQEDHQNIADALASGDLSMAALSPYWYVKAREREPGVHLVATPVRQGNLDTYVGQIVVRAASDIDGIEDLRGLQFCYAGLHSTSGYIYPAALLRRLGYDPRGHFGGVVFTDGNHLKALRYLIEGACDGAAVYGAAQRQAEEAGIAPQESFHVLRSTERIPYDAYVVSPAVDPALVEPIREALLALEPGSPDAQAIVGPADLIGFTPARDSDYDVVAAEIRSLEASGEADTPPQEPEL